MIEQLNDLFAKRYTKLFDKLNSGIYLSEKDGGNFTKPDIAITKGGGTSITGNVDAFALTPPAIVKVELKKFKPFTLVYRIALPRSEMEIAVKNPQYFNYFMDRVLKIALSNYRATVGDEHQVRFGEVYCTAKHPGMDSSYFLELENHDLELRLYGCWASDEAAE